MLNPDSQMSSITESNISSGPVPFLSQESASVISPFVTVLSEKKEENISMVSAAHIISSVADEFHLNSQQFKAFQIIAHHFIKWYILKVVDELPLQMLLTGPGGTGKSHVVRAVKQVMSYYNCGHRIRFLAPTGSAASNIDGMTVHKGLCIGITKKDGRGKGA